jgi:N6-adenosine-specific RNA methylase IME4
VADSATVPDTPPPVESFVKDTAGKTGRAERTVREDAQIGAKLCSEAKKLLKGTPLENRKSDLVSLCKLPKAEQVRIAKVVHAGEANTLRRAKKLLDVRRVAGEPRPLPKGPFRVIVVDPPWKYENRGHKVPYADMTLDEIKDLGVKDLSAKDAVLWLWVTNAHLQHAFTVAKVWGFTYKILLTWDKKILGTGDWLRGQTEHCLLCIRGKPTILLKGQSTLITEARSEHSTKPEAFYKLVESLCPGSKVELFSRKERPGWQSWGEGAHGKIKGSQ